MFDQSESSKLGWNIPASKCTTLPQPRTSRSRSRSPKSDNYLLNIGKYLLKDVVFYGHYQEKRLVAPLNLYRDLIVVSNTETDLKKKLEELKRVYHDQYPAQQIWLGVTDPNTIGAPAGYCIWTNLDEMPFGEYWFRIKRLLFRENEIIIKLKCLRQYDKKDKEIPKVKEPEPWHDIQYDPKEVAKTFKELFDMWKISITELILWFCSVRFTLANSVAVLKFFGLLVVTLVAVTVQFIQYFGVYSIKFMEQFNNLIKVLTPFMLGVLDLISKIIGGFYMLIAMIWKDNINRTAQRNEIIWEASRPVVNRPRLMIENKKKNYPSL